MSWMNPKMPERWSAILRFDLAKNGQPKPSSVLLKPRPASRTVGRIDRVRTNGSCDVFLYLWGFEFYVLEESDDNIRLNVQPPPHLLYPLVLTAQRPQHLALSLTPIINPQFAYYLAEPPTPAELIEALVEEAEE